ncbi:MAG: class I SAM-dependent methyltransferase [Acidobacteria bacterium]|nr:class I SAM-dependent methyltransferase [Acidobacteriota bacterium]
MNEDSLLAWLRLREAADARARSATLTHRIAEVLAGRTPLRLIDLGTGTGSNIRYLAPGLPRPQQWLAVDRSAALLAELRERSVHLDVAIETRRLDLGTLDPSIFTGRHLVTASALLDLASDDWLRALAGHCRTVGASALFTVTYNGWSTCVPDEPEDDWVRELLNQHQRSDKGLGGPAAGPDAVASAERAFAEAGYQVEREPSDWRLGPAGAEMQRMLVDGWAEAAAEMAPNSANAIASWRARRLAHIDAGRSHIIVGHDDLAAWPGDVGRATAPHRASAVGTPLPGSPAQT